MTGFTPSIAVAICYAGGAGIVRKTALLLAAKTEHAEVRVGIENGVELPGEFGSALGAKRLRDGTEIEVLRGLGIIAILAGFEEIGDAGTRVVAAERVGLDRGL